MEDELEPSSADETLADKINRLFDARRRPDGRPYSDLDVERWLAEREAEGPTISANYLRVLRGGHRTNPTMSHLQAIARFFEIDPAYFFGSAEHSAAITADLELLAALRDSEDIRAVALRAQELSPEMRAWLARTVRDLPGDESRRRGRRGGRDSPHSPSGADET